MHRDIRSKRGQRGKSHWKPPSSTVHSNHPISDDADLIDERNSFSKRQIVSNHARFHQDIIASEPQDTPELLARVVDESSYDIPAASFQFSTERVADSSVDGLQLSFDWTALRSHLDALQVVAKEPDPHTAVFVFHPLPLLYAFNPVHVPDALVSQTSLQSDTATSNLLPTCSDPHHVTTNSLSDSKHACDDFVDSLLDLDSTLQPSLTTFNSSSKPSIDAVASFVTSNPSQTQDNIDSWLDDILG
ncbi:hypothetical protein QVD99_000538 [Batrachochytrium dendrobatidis]|nr:hypothetical protein O5D80_008117 [Batrachochytrium dendrobatidis]KAK5673076.1 hypothetical protein QVD99_000538 [Batrachochytrium dendrobatidis]